MSETVEDITARHQKVVEDRVRATAALHRGARVGTAGEAKAGDRVIVGWLPDSEGMVAEIEELKKESASFGTPRDLITYKLQGFPKRKHCSSLDWMIFAG